MMVDPNPFNQMKRLLSILICLFVSSFTLSPCKSYCKSDDSLFIRPDVRECLDRFIADSCSSLPHIQIYVAERSEDTLLVFDALDYFGSAEANLRFVEIGTSIITLGEARYGDHILYLSYITDAGTPDMGLIGQLFSTDAFDLTAYKARVEEWMGTHRIRYKAAISCYSVRNGIKQIPKEECIVNHEYLTKCYCDTDRSNAFYLRIDSFEKTFLLVENELSTYGRLKFEGDSLILIPEFYVNMSKVLQKPIYKELDSLDLTYWHKTAKTISDKVIVYYPWGDPEPPGYTVILLLQTPDNTALKRNY